MPGQDGPQRHYLDPGLPLIVTLATGVQTYPWVAWIDTAGPFSRGILRDASERDGAGAASAVGGGVGGDVGAVVGAAVGVGVDGVVTGVAECKSRAHQVRREGLSAGCRRLCV